MKALIFLMHAGAAALLLATAGCKPHGDAAQTQTKFPGMVTAGGGTSGQVLARSSKPVTEGVYAGGTPGIAGGAGGNTSGAATGGKTHETGQGPSAGVSAPSGTGAIQTTQKQSGDSGNNPVKSSGEQAPQPAAAHRDPGASTAAPGR